MTEQIPVWRTLIESGQAVPRRSVRPDCVLSYDKSLNLGLAIEEAARLLLEMADDRHCTGFEVTRCESCRIRALAGQLRDGQKALADGRRG